MTQGAAEQLPPTIVESAVAERACPGETISGDACAVIHRGDAVVLAVIDGLGHGPEAAAASTAAVRALEEHESTDARALLEHCHAALRRTRGAAISLGVIEHGSLTWLGVGNVEGRLIRPGGARRESIVLRGGIVGYQYSPPYPGTHPLVPGDVLLMATDGLREDFADNPVLTDSLQQIADDTLSGHCRGTDDALVLAVRISRKPS